jgi:ribulose-5-phosphate 4-epimerase/fuculose-1-phosphate aldolase
MQKYTQQIDEFVEACRRSSKMGLQQCSSGNMSARLDDDIAALSASRTWLSNIKPAQVALCTIKSKQSLNNITPTVESNFHLGILQKRENANVVLHFQSPFASTIACSNNKNIDFNVIIEVPYYIGTPGWVDFYPPGSEQLADKVIEQAEKSQIVIMKNHGMVTFGKDYDDAIQKAVFFELACKIILLGDSIAPLSDQQVRLIQNAAKA